MKLSKIVLVFGVGATALLTLTHCGSKEEEKKGVEANFTSLYSNVFSGCASSCHAPGREHYDNTNDDLDFSTQAKAYESLMKTSKRNGCTSFKYAASGAPSTSLAYVVLTKELRDTFIAANASCALPPPADHSIDEISADAVAAVKTWITDGAKND